MAGGASGDGRRALAEINVTPLVDVMLVLLIIFMVSAPILKRGIEVGLPQAASAEVIEEERITVTLDRAGQIFVDGEPVVDDALADEVLARGGDGRKAVYLEGDAGVSYGRVLAAMDALRTAGVARVALVTEPVRPTGGARP